MNPGLARAIGLGVWCAWWTTELWAPGQEPPRSLDSIYPGATELRAATREVVCLVDVEHPDVVREDIRDRAPRFHSLERVRLGIELETAGLPCLLVHASLLNAGDLNQSKVKAVVICGRKRSLDPDGRNPAGRADPRVPGAPARHRRRAGRADESLGWKDRLDAPPAPWRGGSPGQLHAWGFQGNRFYQG